ncbi:unnamed protein product [Linum trigynum]|uniref:Uncharacterized protein n=1 Tax=Linum trigynum TaxID=586398 RepID=A0AAV2DWM4_9ROSI
MVVWVGCSKVGRPPGKVDFTRHVSGPQEMKKEHFGLRVFGASGSGRSSSELLAGLKEEVRLFGIGCPDFTSVVHDNEVF